MENRAGFLISVKSKYTGGGGQTHWEMNNCGAMKIVW